MFKQVTIGEVQIGERSYALMCDPQSPLGEIHDALVQFKAYVVERMIEAQKQHENKELPAQE